MQSNIKTRADAESIFKAAIARVDPEAMVLQSVRLVEEPTGSRVMASDGSIEYSYELGDFDRIFATGMGKATARMAKGLERALGKHLAGGVIVVKEGHVEKLSRIQLLEGSHPVPGDSSVAGATAVLHLGESLGTKLTARDLVIVLVSGGGSSILCAPVKGLSLDDKISTTKLLLASGATINEMNCVRKHLSAVKGGRLASALAPATVLTLVLSDVVGDDLDAIASGPTVPDPTTYANALEIVTRYGIVEKLSVNVRKILAEGIAGTRPETPKPGDPVFASTKTLLIGTNRLAVNAAELAAKQLGYNTLALTSRMSGESREMALLFMGMGKDVAAAGMPLSAPACIIAGGETTVTLRGSGKGGRNQEMALAFLASLLRSPKDGEGLVFLSGGTDGNDGPTDAAGAIVALELGVAARASGVDPDAYLANNDSYTFFEKVGGLLKTGPTNTNVCDIQVLLVRS